jgi:hypothetical protein
MNPDWAAENLQTIRTLMERSALYRRALAPTTLVAGVMGTLGAVVGAVWAGGSAARFCGHWLGVAVATVAACLWVVRRQALRDGEPFWSPPTRRVVQALAPPLFFGAVLGGGAVLGRADDALLWLVLTWVGLYGGALHAAGFFMPRGIRLFGWGLILAASAALLGVGLIPQAARGAALAHGVMGVAFGLAHLAYGGYLLITEKRRLAP